jgi:hypothetical protein
MSDPVDIKELHEQIEKLRKELTDESLKSRLSRLQLNLRSAPPPRRRQLVSVVKPTPPVLDVPGSLAPIWEDYQSFLTGVTQTLGRPNEDQYLTLAQIAAQLSLTAAIHQLVEKLGLLGGG